jgi:hypothetical protein
MIVKHLHMLRYLNLNGVMTSQTPQLSDLISIMYANSWSSIYLFTRDHSLISPLFTRFLSVDQIFNIEEGNYSNIKIVLENLQDHLSTQPLYSNLYSPVLIIISDSTRKFLDFEPLT